MSRDTEIRKDQEFAEKNLDTFRVRYLHKYLVIHKQEVVAVFMNFQDASEFGQQRYGLDEPFYIYHVVEQKPVNFIFHSHPLKSVPHREQIV